MKAVSNKIVLLLLLITSVGTQYRQLFYLHHLRLAIG